MAVLDQGPNLSNQLGLVVSVVSLGSKDLSASSYLEDAGQTGRGVQK